MHVTWQNSPSRFARSVYEFQRKQFREESFFTFLNQEFGVPGLEQFFRLLQYTTRVVYVLLRRKQLTTRTIKVSFQADPVLRRVL